MIKKINKNLLEDLKSKDPTIFGEIFINFKNNSYIVTGELTTSIKNINSYVSNWFTEQNLSVLINLKEKENSFTILSNSEEVETTVNNGPLDEVKILYMGSIDSSMINETSKYKKLNFETIEKVRASYEVVGFLAPIILDSNFNIIDGELRLEVAKRSGTTKIPVVIIDNASAQSKFLRLVLNRSSEFQRWIYEDVDNFVDSYPQLQPILEPLGFFGNNILPTTFFGNTVLEYRIDEYNDQMKEYSQDIGLENWAEMRRKEILTEEERKKKIKETSKPNTDNLISLFDLKPEKEDFTPLNDPYEVIKDHVEKMKEVGETITTNYDIKRKAEKEAKGQEWQTSRRTSKKKAEDLRAEAEEEFNNEILEEEE